MIPSEQATALVDKFYGIRCFPDDHTYDQEPTCHHQAKQCAIICVEQIIEATGADKDENNGYWQRVIHYLKNS